MGINPAAFVGTGQNSGFVAPIECLLPNRFSGLIPQDLQSCLGHQLPYEILQILCDRHRASGVRHRAVPAGLLFSPTSPNSDVWYGVYKKLAVSENTNTGAMSLGPVIGEVTGFLA